MSPLFVATMKTSGVRKAEEFANEVKTSLGAAWLPAIYIERVRGKRSRSYRFDGANAKAKTEIQHTLLGVELKVGRRRMLCPDLATARYLAIFARAGCESVAVPYDITRISQLADELESSWYRMFLLIDHHAADKSEAFRTRIGRLLVDKMKTEVTELGAGSSVPEFKQTTKQRS